MQKRYFFKKFVGKSCNMNFKNHRSNSIAIIVTIVMMALYACSGNDSDKATSLSFERNVGLYKSSLLVSSANSSILTLSALLEKSKSKFYFLWWIDFPRQLESFEYVSSVTISQESNQLEHQLEVQIWYQKYERHFVCFPHFHHCLAIFI